MKKIITAIILLTTISLSSQNETISYQGTGAFIQKIDVKTGKTINDIPHGKNPIVVYDRFFKSYKISYELESGKRLTLDFKFVEQDGELITMTCNDHVYLLADKIKTHKELFFLRVDEDNKEHSMALVISGLVKK